MDIPESFLFIVILCRKRRGIQPWSHWIRLNKTIFPQKNKL